MSTDNLTRLRECLVQLHLPAFQEHYAAQGLSNCFSVV